MNSEKKKTPCEELGYKIGDNFELQEDVYTSIILTIGNIVTLCLDDGSNYPRFRDTKGLESWIPLRILKKCNTISPGVKVYPEPTNKYSRKIYGVNVDVYDVLKAWDVTCPAIQHAIKKLLMPGQRGHKNKLNDLEEAHAAIKRAIELCNNTLEAF